MMTAGSLILLAAVGLVHASPALDARATGQCSPGNNCQRGVGGSGNNPVLASRLADCTSFMRRTVTPAAVTTTLTTTVATVTVTVTPNLYTIAARQVTVSPSVVPAYATYCSNPTAYSSACSCAGVTAFTTTVATPTVTVTSSVTATATATAVACGFGYCGSDSTCVNNECRPKGILCSADPPSCNNVNTCNADTTCDLGNSGCQRRAGDLGTGPGICTETFHCQYPTCGTDADCGAGSACLTTCCGSQCVPVGIFCGSTTPNKPREIFDIRAGLSSNLLPGNETTT